MSVRTFTLASSEKITLSLGALGFAFGPGTIAAVIRTPLTAGGTIFSAGATNAVSYAMDFSAGGLLRGYTNNASSASTTAIAANKWYLLAATKATGTVVFRLHIYDFAAGTWVHENGGTARANSSVPLTEAKIGCTAASGLFFGGDMAAIGVWNVVLSDQQVQDLLLFLPVVSKGLWRLNQDAVGENVLDLSGGGANQSAIVGTTITAVTQPVGMMNLAPPKPEPAAVRAITRAATF